jgi:hypothetical protein
MRIEHRDAYGDLLPPPSLHHCGRGSVHRANCQGAQLDLCWRNLGHTGVVQAPEVVLSTLAHRGVAATVILCPHDTKLFVANKGCRALHRLRKTPAPPTLFEVPDGDHAAYHQSILTAPREAILNFR